MDILSALTLMSSRKRAEESDDIPEVDSEGLGSNGGGSNENGYRNGGIVRKSTVIAWVTVAMGTVAVITWLDTNFVSANDFSQFRTSTNKSLARISVSTKLDTLKLRSDDLEDRIFALNQRQQNEHTLTPLDSSLLSRYLVELNRSQEQLDFYTNQLNLIDSSGN